jgi:pseudaminic acid biosynthesis-associated methylase
MKITEQIKKWSNQFGREYTDRNPIGWEAMNKYYVQNYGVSREAMNKEFLKDLDRDLKILEAGCNIGSQLEILAHMGFQNLFGFDIQEYAIEIAQQRLNNATLKQGSLFEIPFKDKSFDLVYTSGVLIHINPKDLKDAIKEIARCSRRYIWGFEYYSPELKEIHYRGQNDLLWKDDFVARYLECLPGWAVLKKQIYKYTNSDNEDVMFLLECNKEG